MRSKRFLRTVTMLALVLGVPFVLFLTALSSDASPEAIASNTPTPLPTACAPIEYEVVARADVSQVNVGDTFVLRSTSSGFAGLAQTRLYITYRLALVPDLEVIDPLPMVEVLPGSTGSSLGSAEFVLRALEPGIIRLHTEVYGDAYFYSVGCALGTTFKLVQSEPVSVSIVEAEKRGS